MEMDMDDCINNGFVLSSGLLFMLYRQISLTTAFFNAWLTTSLTVE
jgi:hypothetical protein